LIKSTPQNSAPKKGIEVICGSMFSGKTKLLIKKIKHFQDNNCNVKVFKPAIDIRYGNEKIVSHDKSEICAMPIKKSSSFRTIIDIDKALEYEEVVNTNRPLTRSEAIIKLKEQKDLYDLGLISEKEYLELKEKLSPIILKKL